MKASWLKQKGNRAFNLVFGLQNWEKLLFLVNDIQFDTNKKSR